jgi:hypothetical protein
MEHTTAWDWDSDSPATAGWYATVTCWCAREGMFPGAHYFERHWRSGNPIVAFAGPFKTEAEAHKWAYDNDPEG